MVAGLRRVVVFLPYIFVFVASLYLPADPDLGWHLKYGEYFFAHHQILRDNTFSTMMPNYHWMNGTWGTDVITYAIYHASGFWGLSMAGAIIVTATFFFLATAGSMNFLSKAIFFPLFVYLLVPVNSPSFRGQQLSYLFLGLVIFFISKYIRLSKNLLIIPFLFLLWCNVHEEAFLFLTFFGVWVFFVIIKNILAKNNKQTNLHKKENFFLLGILLLSCVATLFNPFGIALLGNALSYFGNTLINHISEYEPYPLFSSNWWSQLVFSLLFITYLISLFSKKTFGKHFPIVIMSAILLLLGFSMRRYLWPAYYVVLSFIFIPSFITKKCPAKYMTLIATIISVLSIIFVLQSKLPFSQFATMSWDTYCQLQQVPCSAKSAAFLQKHKLFNGILSYYDWGGWLIWNYPDIKPSIDGRMTEWRDNTGYSATADYAAYINGKKSIHASAYDVVYLPNDDSPLADALSTLVQQKKWKVVYQDDRVGIVTRINKK